MKRFICFALCILICVSVAALAADYKVTYDGLCYTSDGKSVTIVGYQGISRGVLIVPDKLNGLPVKHIGDEAFAGLHHLTGVILPDSIESIGNIAFQNMVVDKLVLGNGVKSIGSGAFNLSDSLEKIIIPSGVAKIQADTFTRCPLLEKVIITNTDIKIDKSAFDEPSFYYNTLTIYARDGSDAQKFAANNGFNFKPYIPILINGQELAPSYSIAEIKDGKLFVPLRFVAEALYHPVDYMRDGFIQIDGAAFHHTIGNNYVTDIGDTRLPLESKTYAKNGVTMVGIDFIKQTIRCDIVWNKVENRIEITAK